MSVHGASGKALPNSGTKGPLGLPDGPVVGNLPASAGGVGSIPGPGRFHMLQGHWACAPQLLRLVCSRARAPQQKPPLWEAHAPQRRGASSRHNRRNPVHSNGDPTQPKIKKESTDTQFKERVLLSQTVTFSPPFTLQCKWQPLVPPGSEISRALESDHSGAESWHSGFRQITSL